MVPFIEHRADERSRLKAALARVGDPEEFLAPLVAIADTSNGTRARIRRLVFYLTRSTAFLVSTLALTLVLVFGLAVLGASLASLFDPSRFGVFSLGDDKIRIGTTAGLQVGSYRQVLSPLTASLFAMVSCTAIVGVLIAIRMLVLRLLALTYSASLRALL